MHLLADITKLKNFIDWEPKISLQQGISTLIERQPLIFVG
jgi:nucleoside-diphosphate-sugar epimerase